MIDRQYRWMPIIDRHYDVGNLPPPPNSWTNSRRWFLIVGPINTPLNWRVANEYNGTPRKIVPTILALQHMAPWHLYHWTSPTIAMTQPNNHVPAVRFGRNLGLINESDEMPWRIDVCLHASCLHSQMMTSILVSTLYNHMLLRFGWVGNLYKPILDPPSPTKPSAPRAAINKSSKRHLYNGHNLI